MPRRILPLVLSLPVLAAALALPVPARAGQDDWPMLAHDVRRTGATTATFAPPARRAWVRYFHMEGLMPSVQPVVVDGRLYLGTLAGTFYALDAATGRDLWKATVGGPVFHTACVTDDGLVVFGAGDGTIYALRTADGSPAWTHATGAPIWNAPLAHGGRVYIGGRDGVLYCLNTADGSVAWRYDAGAPLFQSPALDPDRGQVYCTGEDRIVHAVDAATGEPKWRSAKLPGTTARSFHLVVAPDGTVMTNAIPYHSFDRGREPLEAAQRDLLGTETLVEPATRHPGTYTRMPNWRHAKEQNDRFDEHVRGVFAQPDYVERFLEALTRHVEADPQARCLFLLDPDTGREKAMVPVLYTAFAKSAFTPPLVAPDGRVITKWLAFLPSTYQAYQQEVNLAYVDTATGALTPVFDESRVFSGRGLGLIADESCQLSVLGNRLVNIANHYGEIVGSFDLSDPQRRAFGQYYTTHTHWWGVGVIHRILRGQEDRIAPGQEDLTKGFGVGNPGELATGNHTAANMPVVIAGGRMFYASAGKLMALEPAERAPEFPKSHEIADYGIEPLTDEELQTLYETWPINWDEVDVRPADGQWGDHAIHTPDRVRYVPGTKENPDADAGARADAVTDAQLDTYIRQALQPGRLPDTAEARAAQARLVAAVEEMISQPQWMPYRFQGGKHPVDYLELYTDPSEPLEALAWAYPFLPAELQARVRAYVQAGWVRQNPILVVAELPSGEGAAREAYEVPDGVTGRVFRFGRAKGIERAYVAWLWADRSGDWDAVRQLWPSLRGALATARPQMDRDAGNLHCASLIAACRLAERFEDAETLAAALPLARQALRERLRHEWTYHEGNVVGRQISLWNGFVRWEHLAPEVGRLLAEQAAPVAPRLVANQLDRLRPYWYLAWGPLSPASLENSLQLPHNNLSGFLAQAFVRADADPARLVRYADIPACKGDPYFVQKLAIALTAMSSPTWEPAP